ncbi:hypothetical protein AOQ71_10180 [Bradyrhizobium manausense]|uniref:Uncharacterized protein n=2 Tax=Bradyrhizobium manausense TaxID=989370 RepID=A0A0R3E4K0_9BRAD|nr:hypothetical protein AOQ71_10180 [Bradyrhizobium manausense]
MMEFDWFLLGFGCLLLVLWVISSTRPRMRKMLLRYHFVAVYDWTLFLVVLIPGWDLVTMSGFAVSAFIIIGILGIGELAIRKETGVR